jgi:signal transduction histidine kinase
MLTRIEAAFVRVSQFTADASHELRTPVSLIRTEAEIALRKSRHEAEYRDALGHILVEAERTSELIEELFSLARADAGQEKLNIGLVDLRRAVQEAASEWRRIAAAQGLEFIEHLDEHNIFISADRSFLKRLLNILLDNAVKYTPQTGSIKIELEEHEGKAVITVCDTGIGISPEDQARIFERFYRADKARSHESGGAGLGLAIAHWIVEQHGGSIAVNSTLGKGSSFVVQFSTKNLGTSMISKSQEETEVSVRLEEQALEAKIRRLS